MSGRPKGEDVTGAKLTNEQARQVRHMRHRFGTPIWELARIHNVARRTIRDVLDGVSYQCAEASAHEES